MRKKTILLLVILLILLIAAGYLANDPEMRQQVLVELELATPEAQQYTAMGFLEATTLQLSAENGGKVVALPVEEGEAVQAGEILAQLDTTLLEAQYNVAQAKLQGAQAALEMAQAGPRPVDYQVALKSMQLAQTALDQAQDQLEKARLLPEEDPNRESKIAQAEADVAQARAQVSEAGAGLRELYTLPKETDLQSARAGVDSAQSDVDQIQAQIERQTLTVHLDGILLERLILPGEVAQPGWPLLIISDLSELTLTVYIPEADLNWVQVGASVKVRVDAYPDRTFPGEVIRIADQAEFTPRNVQTPKERVILVYAVTIRVPNPDLILKPGLPADAIFEEQN